MPSSLADYDIISSIGSGSYGTCKKICRKKDQKVCAVFSLLIQWSLHLLTFCSHNHCLLHVLMGRPFLCHFNFLHLTVILYSFMLSLMVSSHLFLGLPLFSFFPASAKFSSYWWYPSLHSLTRGHTIAVVFLGKVVIGTMESTPSSLFLCAALHTNALHPNLLHIRTLPPR